MNTFEKIIHALQGTMETPTNYGWFHLVSIAAIAVLTVAVCLLLKNAKQKTFRVFVFVCWLVILLLEVYKQLVFSFELVNGSPVWDYQWYAFPFQFCSVQLFLLPFVFCLKDGKVRTSVMAFLSLFSFFGGLVVFIYPNDVFISTIGINIQTMVHHGLQIVLGIFFIVYNRKKLSFKYYLSGLIVFAVCLAVAMALNFIIPNFTDETFNMFYISPKFDCTLPVLDKIYPNVHYAVFLSLYILGFAFIGLVLFFVFYAFANLLNKERLARANKTKLILSTLFVLIEIAVLILILFVDTGITRYLEFSGIALAGIFPLIFINPNKNAFSINIGLILTIFADIFLVLLNPANKVIGIIFFVLVQLCYFLFLISNTKSKANQISNVVTRLVLTAGIIVACVLLLKDKVDFLSIISVIYFANLFVNLVFAYAGGKKSLAFAIGLTLFILCDIIIGLQVAAGDYLTISESSIVHKIIFADFNIAWAVYLPSQVIIALFAIYSTTLSSSFEKEEVSLSTLTPPSINELVVSSGETTIVNTNNPNMKIVRKHNGKTKAEINIVTNNIPVLVDSSGKKEKPKKLKKPKKEKKVKEKKVKEKKTKKQEEQPKIETPKQEPKVKETKKEPEKKPAKSAASKTTSYNPRKYSNNRPKMVVRNKIRKFETFRKD
ncbi:MAG: YwaF family protein [Clostridia bacterium]|nr:YwaF family protein [Clostridia bacterium]